jgi:hypothetical protein
MCMICKNIPPTNYQVYCNGCMSITLNILTIYAKKYKIKLLILEDTNITEIPHISGLKELYCDCTNITEIPHIDGLKKLYCANTKITELHDIDGCDIISYQSCNWLEENNLQKVITSQKMIRNYYMRKKLVHIRDQLMPIYFHPEMKGGYLHKKSMMADF